MHRVGLEDRSAALAGGLDVHSETKPPSIWMVGAHATQTKSPFRRGFQCWLPVEDYLQTSHGLAFPADLISS